VATGNVFRYDVSHNNIDDGWDLFTKTDTGPIGPVTIEFSLSYNNGTLSDGSQSGNGDRNGFKLGGDAIAVTTPPNTTSPTTTAMTGSPTTATRAT